MGGGVLTQLGGAIILFRCCYLRAHIRDVSFNVYGDIM
jgi:hypothetical protein